MNKLSWRGGHCGHRGKLYELNLRRKLILLNSDFTPLQVHLIYYFCFLVNDSTKKDGGMHVHFTKTYCKCPNINICIYFTTYNFLSTTTAGSGMLDTLFNCPFSFFWEGRIEKY